MTEQQLTAYNAPCFHAEQCFQREYFHSVQLDKQVWVIGLTANIGLE